VAEQIILGLCVVMLVSTFAMSSQYYTMYAAFDWYSPDSVVAMEIYNVTFFHILESLLLLLCFVINRHYPREFNIKSEILLAALLSIVFSNGIEFSSFNNQSDSCVFGLLHFNTVGDLFRSLGFVAVLYYLTKKSNQYFPLPFTWIFKDLSKFIFEPTCIKVYQQYLSEKEPAGSSR